MKVTKTNESKFEVEFDGSERKVLDDMESIFEQTPEDMIQKSLDESIRLVAIGTANLVERIHAKVTAKNGHSD